MKTELNAKDVSWIARGVWEHHFNWRFHPITKVDWAVAIALGTVGLIVLVIGAMYDAAIDATTPAAFIGAVILIAGVVFFFKGQHQYQREKQDYIDYAVDRWEHGDRALPSLESLKNWAPGFEKPRHEGV